MSAAADLTLRDALEKTYRERWAGTRSEKTLLSQARSGLDTLARLHLPPKTGPLGMADLGAVKMSRISRRDVPEIIKKWYAQGLSPATINKRLNCLSAMGVSVDGHRVREPKVLKWWLRPEVEEQVVKLLNEAPGLQPAKGPAMALLVRWTTRTGLRIEESLRLKWSDFSGDRREVTVPGTKTATSQVTLALGRDVTRMIEDPTVGSDGPFPLDYDEAHEIWQAVRVAFGFDSPTATLKALRRSAARYLHYDRGMPLDMVRQYLRHENIETTMGYLRLTGGVSLEEQRRYLG